jgi:uncharacterized protein (TIGR00297 family)
MSIFKTLFYAPPKDWLYFAVFLLGIALFIAVAEKARTVRGWSPEINRKLVHILTGVLIFFCPFFFVSGKPLVWMALLFIAVNWIGIRTGKLKGMHSTARKSFGTVYYPMTFLILVLTCWKSHKVVLILSMLILALADAAAAIMGENLKNPHEYRLGEDKKSIEGSGIMLLVSFLVIFILLPVVGHLDGLSVDHYLAAWIGLIVAVVATALEALSTGGSDNLTSPLGAAFILSFMLSHTAQASLHFTLGLGLALVVAVLSYNLRFLRASGSVGTFLLATLIFGVGGWIWSVPILTFFLLSSLLSKMGRKIKASFDLTFEKSSCRDAGQVLANGGAAGAIMILYTFYPDPIWYLFYLSALAAVNGDTWATEIGIFSKTDPRSIKDFRRVPSGTSGGITPAGLSAALVGSLVIIFVGWLVAPAEFNLTPNRPYFWMAVVSGFLATLVDSFLGATIQGQYFCDGCRRTTEKTIHCQGQKTGLVSGYGWLNNDRVNAIASVSGILFVWMGIKMLAE